MITSEKFAKLYKKDDSDELITPLQKDVGISILKKYDSQTEFYKKDKRMLIYLILQDDYIVGGVDMVNSNVSNNGYRSITNEKFKKGYTNFSFGKEENLKWDNSKFNVTSEANQSKNFTLNEFVKILIKNHLSDRLVFRKFVNNLITGLLKFTFWLVDKKYKYYEILLGLFSDKEKVVKQDDLDKRKEPFFKYFSIPRNMLFFTLTILFAISLLFDWLKIIYNFQISNDTKVLLLFLIFFIFDSFSKSLSVQINNFYNKENSTIAHIAKYANTYSFNLKLKI